MVTRIVARAKLNLCLRVTGVRADGYHYLESVMHQVEWGDELMVDYVRTGPPRTVLQVEGPDLPVGRGNIAWRAAEAMRRVAGLQGEIRLTLRKIIPIGAGLGGGSSDAAAVLNALADHPAVSVDDDKFARVAKKLGADVPFALAGGAALVTGIGDVIKPLHPRLGMPVLLVHPPVPLSTPRVFGWWDEAHGDSLSQDNANGAIISSETRTLALAVEHGKHADWPKLLVNDLQEVVCERVPAVRQALQVMHGAPGVLASALTGSGSTVFALLESADAGARLVERLGSGYRTTATRLVRAGERRRT